MKLSTGILLLAVYSTKFTATLAQDPCEDDGEECTGLMKSCTEDEDGCCAGFGCYGYNFFKRCQETPICLEEWFACNPNPGENEEAMECCEGLTCVSTGGGLPECQTPTKRTVEVPGFNVEEHVDPTPAPPTVPTQTYECPTPKVREARLTGDPHFRTFDGLTYDCQGIGEHIIYKTKETSREVQGRFVRVKDMSVSVTHGVAMRDQGGADIPRVQVSIPATKDSESTVLGTSGCQLQGFVNGEQFSLKEGYQSDAVTVKLEGTSVTTTYNSGFKVRVSMGYWNGCLLNTYLTVPVCEGDEFTGLLGDGDGKAMNDWITRDGKRVKIPDSTTDRRRKPAYDYCVPNWCLTDVKDSIFHYNEVGHDFGYYSRCMLPYGESLVEFVEDLPAKIVQDCQGDLGCMMDALNDDADTVEATIRQTRIDNFELNADQCSVEDADCSGGSKCCNGLTCLKFSPTDWKCRPEASLKALDPKCNPLDGGYCNDIGCCDDRVCSEKVGADGKKLFLCETPAECVPETEKCDKDADCCGDGMSCVSLTKGKKGKRKTCQELPTPCSKKNDPCFDGQSCCDGFTCKDNRCKKIEPLKWGKTCATKKDPKHKKCKDKLACMPWKDRFVCADPGLNVKNKCLKKGAMCTIGNTEMNCCDGYTCQKPSKKELKKYMKKFLKKFPDAAGDQLAMLGQCRKKGEDKKREEYLKKKKTAQTVDDDDDDEEKDPDVPAPEKCVLKRASALLNYKPDFPAGRPDVSIEVKIANGDGRIFQFFPKNHPDYTGGTIPVVDNEVFKILFDAQEKLGGSGFKMRYRSRNGPGAWNSCKYSPIALDLNFSGDVEKVTRPEGYEIDITGNGDTEHLAEWFGPNEGILIDTHDGVDGGIVDGTHLIGDMGGQYADGFEKLATYDINGDGFLTGSELDGLMVWVDGNSNLLVDEGESMTFDEIGIVALDTAHENLESTAYLQDGSEMHMEDLWFTAFGARRRRRMRQ